MLIADIYDPPAGQQGSAEENIIFCVKDFYDEIRRIIFDTKVIISPLKTKKSGQGATGAPRLAESLNLAFKIGLESCGWQPLKSPGAESPMGLIDWFKSKPSGRRYGAEKIGLGLEIQFGNNYQFNEDIKRLSEAYLAGHIVAGISIVPSDSLADYKADRGAFFSDAKSKLDRHLESLASAGARRFPPIVIIAIENDDFNDDPTGYFEITPVKVTRDERNVLTTKPQEILTNKDDNNIIQRRQKLNPQRTLETLKP